MKINFSFKFCIILIILFISCSCEQKIDFKWGTDTFRIIEVNHLEEIEIKRKKQDAGRNREFVEIQFAEIYVGESERSFGGGINLERPLLVDQYGNEHKVTQERARTKKPKKKPKMGGTKTDVIRILIYGPIEKQSVKYNFKVEDQEIEL